jgi:hypothetical protein
MLPKGDGHRLSSAVSTVERGALGPMGASATNARPRHFITVLRFSP